MWKALWKKWTIDKPAALGDWLWDIFVVQLAALLERLTLRKIIAFIPIVIFILAYAHRIPIPPEVAFVGDRLAYVDVFAVLLLLGLLSRAATILYIVKQATARVAGLASDLLRALRLDFRHRREGGARNRSRMSQQTRNDDDEHAVIHGAAWA